MKVKSGVADWKQDKSFVRLDTLSKIDCMCMRRL